MLIPSGAITPYRSQVTDCDHSLKFFAYISTPKMIKQYTLGGKWNGNFSDYFSNNSRVIFTGSFIESLELGYERGVLKSKTLSF